MKESFNKFTRDSGEDLKIRNYKNDNVAWGNDIKTDFVDAVEQAHAINEKIALDIEGEFGIEIWPKIEFIYQFAINYFQNLGIENVKFNPFYLVTNVQGSSGESKRIGGITMRAPAIYNKEMKQLQFLKTLAHELYHSVAAVSLTVIESKPETAHLHRHIPIEEGASYRQGDNDKLLALEEGLASNFETMAFDALKNLFSSDTLNEYDRLITLANDQLYTNVKNRNTINIDAANEDGQIQVSITGYEASHQLVERLSCEIQRFNELVENMRLKRHSLPLVRAIEERFGKGSYRKITTCTTDEADNLMTELFSNS